MSEVYFYHLTRAPLSEALPDLLGKILGNNWRALVRASTSACVEDLDARIWLKGETSFLPHGISGGPHDADQPILLTTDPKNANAADVLLLVDRAQTTAAEAQSFTRVCLMFDGNNDAELDQARADWKSLTDAGLPAQYWAQEDGRWTKKLEKPAA